jgi:tetratricopeptide (TPR) repeat protein
MRKAFLASAASLLTACGGTTGMSGHEGHHDGDGDAHAPLLDGLGDYHRAIATASPDAQRYFDQGLRLVFAYNYDEAARSFREATRLDPTCVSCAWGYAFALGPYNNDESRQEPGAVAAADHAVALAKAHGTPLERQLTEALRKRLADPAPEDRQALNDAYGAAMRAVGLAFPDDVDVQDLTAEALLMTNPQMRGNWQPDGTPTSPVIPEARGIEERALKLAPNHPGLNHLYIHTLEGSQTERVKAEHAAEILMTAMPSAGHLTHMPSHIFMRIGRLAEAEEANRRAIAADRAYLAAHNPGGTYPMMIHHNESVLWAILLMRGESKDAIAILEPMLASVNDMLHHAPPMFQVIGRNTIPMIAPQTLVRFAHWDDVLALPLPEKDLPAAAAVMHWARGLAFIGQHQLDRADAEGRALDEIAAAFPSEMPLAILRPMVDVAKEQLAGALAEAHGDRAGALAHLEKAVAAQDQLPPDLEPPAWNVPSRHMLGAVLLAAGKAHEAELVYREDLRRSPENGWALAGLAAALRAQRSPEADAVTRRFDEAWKAADVKTTGSLLPSAR